jgi:hypothetical protein
VHVAAPEPPKRKGSRARKRLVVEEELSSMSLTYRKTVPEKVACIVSNCQSPTRLDNSHLGNQENEEHKNRVYDDLRKGQGMDATQRRADPGI